MVFYLDSYKKKKKLYIFKHFRAVDNPGEKGGSFDSSGAFHDNHFDDEHHYNMRHEQQHEVRSIKVILNSIN